MEDLRVHGAYLCSWCGTFSSKCWMHDGLCILCRTGWEPKIAVTCDVVKV